MEIRQQWIPTPFKDKITVFHDLQQDLQVSNVELSLDLHAPNISLEQIYAPPVVHNNRALTEFIQGEEWCLKFINQDVMFLQKLQIPSTFTNVSHTPNIVERTHAYYPSYTHLKRTNFKRK